MTRCLFRFFDPFFFRDRLRCSCLSFFSALRKNRGEWTREPSAMTAKWVSPRSTPWSRSCGGRVSFAGSVSTTKPARYRPAASLITVTVDGADGRARDQRTRTGPILGRFSFPSGVIDHFAFAVNRTH